MVLRAPVDLQIWNAVTKCEKTDGLTLCADLCCLSHEGQYIGVVRRHDNGNIIVEPPEDSRQMLCFISAVLTSRRTLARPAQQCTSDIISEVESWAELKNLLDTSPTLY